MTIKEFVEKAMEGGYNTFGGVILDSPRKAHQIPIQFYVLDPAAWEAVGKVEGWDKKCWIQCGVVNTFMPAHESVISESALNMHRMIDALAEGHTIEQFLADL